LLFNCNWYICPYTIILVPTLLYPELACNRYKSHVSTRSYISRILPLSIHNIFKTHYALNIFCNNHFKKTNAFRWRLLVQNMGLNRTKVFKKHKYLCVKIVKWYSSKALRISDTFDVQKNIFKSFIVFYSTHSNNNNSTKKWWCF